MAADVDFISICHVMVNWLDFVTHCQKLRERDPIMHLSMSSWRGGRWGIGRDFDRSPWPGGRAFQLSCCPGGRDIWIFVRARDQKSFPGRGISVIFDLTFLHRGREFDSNFLENVKIPPYAPPPPPPPRRLDIDRCIRRSKQTIFIWNEAMRKYLCDPSREKWYGKLLIKNPNVNRKISQGQKSHENCSNWMVV